MSEGATSLHELLQREASLHSEGDLDGLQALREEILTAAPESEDAARSAYKLGVDALMRRRDPVAALDYFEQAMRMDHAFWRDSARTSYAILLHRGGKTQKAIFELRKVALSDPPSAHSVTALSMMESMYEEAANEAELGRTRAQRIRQLETLAGAADKGENAVFRLQLAAAYLDEGRSKDARAMLPQLKEDAQQHLGEREQEAFDNLRRSLEGE